MTTPTDDAVGGAIITPADMARLMPEVVQAARDLFALSGVTIRISGSGECWIGPETIPEAIHVPSVRIEEER